MTGIGLPDTKRSVHAMRPSAWGSPARASSAMLLIFPLISTAAVGQTAQVIPGSHLQLGAPDTGINAPSPNLASPDRQATRQNLPGTLELTLQQAIRMALEKNLDIQIEQVDQTVADAGIRKALGGGTPSQIRFSVAETPAGVGLAATPLLTSVGGLSSPASVDPSGISIAPSYDTGHVLELQHSLSIAQAPYSPGSVVPGFDASLQGQYAWIRRDPSNSINPASASVARDTVTTNNTLGSTTLLKGFSTGTALQLGVNDFVQSFYSGRSTAVPFTHPNAIALIAQPLLRGAGRANNTRFIAIAKTNKQISATLLEQQMISTVSGVEALYYDLVGLQKVVQVQQKALAAAQQLLKDDQQQLAVGRMPPIEVARAESLVTANQLAVTEAEARRQQQGNILRSVLDPESLTAPDGTMADLVAIDALPPLSDEPQNPVAELIQGALAQRPDIRQAKLQLSNGKRAVAGSANARLPEVDLYGSFQSRGVIIPSLVPIGGDPTTGTALIDPVPAGGKSASQVFEAGIQFNLPLQNRVAEANLGADRAELRLERLRLTQLESQAAAEVRNTLIGLNAAKTAFRASSASMQLQERLLSAEAEKFNAGMSSNFAVIQQQTYLAQAETTEVAAEAAIRKAEVQLERALGKTLQLQQIEVPNNVPESNRIPTK